MKLRDQVKETLSPILEPSNGVFNTGYTLDELESELERRDQAIQKVEKRTDKYHRRKKKYLEKAASAKNQRKLRFVSKAKEAEMYKSFFSELFDNLMAQQLFLTKLCLEAKRRQIFDSPMDEFGFDIDIAGMNVEAVTDSLQRSDLQQEEIGSTMEEIQMEFDTMDHSGLSLDLKDLKEEADMLEASDIESGSTSFDLGEDWNSAIDEQIQDELEQMEDQFNESTSTAEAEPEEP